MIKIKKSKIKKLKWGVAGCGYYAEHTFIPALSIIRRSKLVSLYSHKKKRAQQLAEKSGATGYFNNYDDFLKSDINCVYVASVNSDHYEQVIKAANAGKHILCEKPLAITADQAEEMVNACKENKVLLAVNYVHRFHPHVIKAKELIRNQTLGKLVTINLNFNIDFPPGSNFRFNKKLSGGGAFRDLGTHMIDLLRFLGGEISDINGYIDNLVYKSDVDDFAAAIVKFKNGGYGYLNVSYNNKRAFNRIEILGHKGAISIDRFIGVKHQSAKLTILPDGEAKMSFRKRGNKINYMLRSVQKSFIKNEQPLVTGEDGLINMKLMEELERKCRK
ncbi:MAG: gfo/Idh/MocA family oxidoreductase [Ignavibacteriae bacterium]|nr:MAG: gfo/Idh/MocA family oxidoreductase [Ignavibacteriota bacterium]